MPPQEVGRWRKRFLRQRGNKKRGPGGPLHSGGFGAPFPIGGRSATIAQMLDFRISRSLPKISSMWCFSAMSGGDMAMMSPVVRISRPFS